MKHARLPPSSAFRWMDCSSSISFIEQNAAILPRESSPEADEGTRGHALLTAQLTGKPGQTADNAEMQQVIDGLIQFVLSRRKPGDKLLVDQRVPLFYLPSQRGTLDIAILQPDRITVIDLKYGKGVSVYAERNTQLAIYAESQIRVLEMVEELDASLPVDLIIYQPRDRNDPQIVREWNITRGELAMFCFDIAAVAESIQAGRNLKFSPGQACKFCPATGICKAYATQGLLAISDEPVDAVLDAPLPFGTVVTREQRQRVLKSKKALIEWLEAVENQEIAELMANAPLLDFKLVEGKSNRQWANDKDAAKFLAAKGVPIDAIYPPMPLEICSPKQGEDALKAAGVKLTKELKTAMAPLVTKPTGKATLVPIADPRPPLCFDPTSGLEKLTDVYEGI